MPGNGVGTSTGGIGSIIGLVLGLALLCLVIAMISSGGGNVPPPPTPAPTPMPQSTGTPNVVGAGNPSSVIVNIQNTNPKIEDAIIRVMETGETDDFDENVLSLQGCANGQNVSVWAPGYYILTFTCQGPSAVPYNVLLEPINPSDDLRYSWTSAGIGSNPSRNCGSCHAGIWPGLNEYSEWFKDGHSKVFTTPYFRTTYLGTTVDGQPSQQIQWDILPDGQKIYPVVDPMQDDFGAGYRLDYPVSNGNCSYCHVPAGSPGTLDEMNVARVINGALTNHVDAVTEGITCDVCHKVTDVLVDKNTRLPYDDRPGILSMSVVRPISNQQFVYGPLGYQTIADMSVKRTCFPIFSESKFCAACHYGKFANTVIYGSYKEWLDTPYYSNRANSTYRSCQDCHMIGQEKIGNTLAHERDACSDANVQFSDFNHNMMRYEQDQVNPVREIPKLVQGAAQLSLEATLSAGQIHVKATVTNTGAGHKFPTDSPLRHLLLLLDARDWRNQPLTQTAGPTVPVWAAPDYGGYPGQIYANILKDKDTNLAPSFAYWNPVESAWSSSDTRLPPLVAVPSVYSFTAPYDRSATIKARLIYRREFLNVVNEKGWPLGDLDVEVTQAALECSGFGPDPQTMVCRTLSEQ